VEPEAFFIKHGVGMLKRKLEAVEAVKFLWKRNRKHFEEEAGGRSKLESD